MSPRPAPRLRTDGVASGVGADGVVGAGTPERAPRCSGAGSVQPTGGGGVGRGGGGKEECYSATAAIGDGGQTPSIEGMEGGF
jgi:hypothetical protein